MNVRWEIPPGWSVSPTTCSCKSITPVGKGKGKRHTLFSVLTTAIATTYPFYRYSQPVVVIRSRCVGFTIKATLEQLTDSFMQFSAHGLICNRLSALLSGVNEEEEGTNLCNNPPGISPLPGPGASVSTASPASPTSPTSPSALVTSESRFHRCLLFDLKFRLLCLTITPP